MTLRCAVKDFSVKGGGGIGSKLKVSTPEEASPHPGGGKTAGRDGRPGEFNTGLTGEAGGGKSEGGKFKTSKSSVSRMGRG